MENCIKALSDVRVERIEGLSDFIDSHKTFLKHVNRRVYFAVFLAF